MPKHTWVDRWDMIGSDIPQGVKIIENNTYMWKMHEDVLPKIFYPRCHKT